MIPKYLILMTQILTAPFQNNPQNAIYGNDLWADYLVGKVPYKTYQNSYLQPNYWDPVKKVYTHSWWSDIYSLPGSSPTHINWVKAFPQNWIGHETYNVPMPLDPWISGTAIYSSLVKRYAQTRNTAYVDKWFLLVQDFSASILSQRKSLSDAEQLAANLWFYGGASNSGKGRGSILSFASFCNTTFDQLGEIAKITAAPPRADMLDMVTHQDYVLSEQQAAMLNAGQRINTLTTTLRDQFFQIIFDSYTAYGKDYVVNQRFWGLSMIGKYVYTYNDGTPGWAAWKTKFDTAYTQLLKETIAPDGEFLERSYDYNKATVGFIQDLITVAQGQNAPWFDAATKAVEHWTRFSEAIASPWHAAPQLANEAWSPAENITTAKKTFAQNSIAFPYSGYAAIRSGWDSKADYLFFDAGVKNAPKWIGHGIPGANSIQLAAGGKQLLVNGGNANYVGTADTVVPDQYLSEDSSWKANTILVDGLSQRRWGTSKTQTPKRWLASANYSYTESTWDAGYTDPANTNVVKATDVSHQRKIVYDQAHHLFFVVDLVKGLKNHNYTQVWKFAPTNTSGAQTTGFTRDQVDITAPQQVVTRAAYTGAENLAIRQFGATLTYSKFDGAAGERFGYYGTGPSNAAGHSVDVHADFAPDANGNAIVISVLSPYQGTAGPSYVSATNTVAGGTAGVDLVYADGSRSSLRVANQVSTLRAGTAQATGDLLLATTDQTGAVKDLLVTGDPTQRAASFLQSGGTTTYIDTPSMFAWTGNGTPAAPLAEQLFTTSVMPTQK